MEEETTYGIAQQIKEVACMERKPTTRERLVAQRDLLTRRLQTIKDALEALDSNPEFERVHNLISKAL